MAKPNSNTTQIIHQILKILNEYDTALTVRQAYYQTMARGLKITKNRYENINGKRIYTNNAVSAFTYIDVQDAISKGRKAGIIPWDRIEDRTRRPETPQMWNDTNNFIETVLKAYRRNIWSNQPHKFEIWLEKNALMGLMLPIANKYGITIQPCIGFASDSTYFDCKDDIRLQDGDTILYFGDHDVSGIQMDKNIERTFREIHNLNITVERIGLLYEDIDKYRISPNPTKEEKTKGYETQKKKYYLDYEKEGELDGLPPDILQKREEDAILSHLDIPAYRECMQTQKEELNTIQSRFGNVQER